MLFLKKRKIDGEEDYEDVSAKKPINDSDFKKLKYEKKRKKDLPKPWGRRERILVLFLIVMTTGISGILSLSARAWKLPGFPELKVPSLKLPYFAEKTIVLEGEESLVDRRKVRDVILKFKEASKNLSGVYGLYVVRLGDGSAYGVSENETFQAASLIKLPVMVAMYKEVEGGNLNLDTKYTLKLSDKKVGSGSLYAKSVGYTLTYRDLIRLMGKQSDNTAFAIVRNVLGDEKINNIISETGMANTSLEDNETTPYDIGVFLENLWRGNVVSEESKDEIISLLTDTIYEDHLAAGIPEGIPIAHKFGREVHVVNDAGIVFSSKPFALVIMSKGVVEKEADKVFPEIAHMVYEIESE